MSKGRRALLILGGLAVLFICFVVPTLWLAKSYAIWLVYWQQVDRMASLTGINQYLVTAAALLLFVPFWFATRMTLSLRSRRRRYVGAALLLVFAVFYNIGLYVITRDTNFDPDGRAHRWYAWTPAGMWFADREGVDPTYGIRLRPVTPAIAGALEELRRKGGLRPADPTRLIFFDPMTGEARVWFYRYPEGDVEFYEHQGHHPITGVVLEPVTQQVVLEWRSSRTAGPRDGLPPGDSGTQPSIAVGLIRSGSTGGEEKRNIAAFTDSIISRLVQTKRFRVLDRHEVEEVLTAQPAGLLEEGRELRNAMGSLRADYLLVGSVSVFTVETQTSKLPQSTRTFTQRTGRVEGHFKVVEAASGGIRESRKVAVRMNLDEAGGGAPTITGLADAFATETVKVLIDAIYPIKVVAIGSDGTAYVNRGSDGGLREGDRFRAYRPGRGIIDRDSGARMGAEEVEVGDVVIQQVEDARSKAKASQSALAAGDLLRREGGRASRGEDQAAVGSGRTGAGSRQTGALLAPTQTGKARLAVGTFRVASGGRTDGASTQLSMVTNELIAKLANTNRFQVMERQEVDQVLDEKAFRAASSGTDVRRALQRLKGADYLIYGEISNFYVETRQRAAAPYLNEVAVERMGVGEGTVRIVEVATGAVMAADVVRVKEAIGDAPDGPASLGKLTDRFTTDAVSRILGRVFLTTVIAVQPDGTIYVSRGSDGNTQVRTVFDVMRPGKDVIDPHTGASFGRAESRVGSVEVVAVEASRSRARLLDGQTPVVGDILRSGAQTPPMGQPKVMRPAF